MTDAHERQQVIGDVTLQKVIRHIGALVAIIAPISIVVSFVYDWGFFSALGISFQEAPTTLHDHVRSWLVWLPRVLVSAGFLLAIEFFLRRIEGGKTEEEIVSWSSNPKKVRIFRNSLYIFTACLGPIMVILWLLFGKEFRDGLLIGLVIIWFLFSKWTFDHPRLNIQYSRSFRLGFHWMIPAILLTFFLGELSANTKIYKVNIPQELRLYDTIILESSGSKQVTILRAFDKWTLIRDKDDRVMWISANQIHRIELSGEDRTFPGLICVFWNNTCVP